MQIFNQSTIANATLVFINNDEAKNELIANAVKYATVRTLLDGDTSLFKAMLDTLKANKALKIVKGKEKENAPLNDGQNYYDYARNRKGDIYRTLTAINAQAFDYRSNDFKGFKKSDFNAELIAVVEAYAEKQSVDFINHLELIKLEKKAVKSLEDAGTASPASNEANESNEGNESNEASTPVEVERVAMELPQGFEFEVRNGALIGLTVNGVFLSVQTLQDTAKAINEADTKATKAKAKKAA